MILRKIMNTLMHTQVAIKVNAVKNKYTATREMWKPIGIYSLTFVSACFSHNENKIWRILSKYV